MTGTLPRLCDFGRLWRLGIGLLVICLVGGYAVSGVYLKQHYENRDERAGLSFTDIQGAYAGAVSPSLLLSAIEDGHPEGLGEADRTALLDWLRGGRVREDYENFDLGEAMPADIIAISCVSCHSRGAAGEDAYPSVPLDYSDDVFAIAQSKEILPKDPKIIIQSLHAHMPAMATCSIALAILAGFTRWPRALVGLLVTVTAVGLVADFAGQWFARTHAAGWTWAIVLGGFAATGGVSLLGLLAVADAWLPRGRARDDLDD